MHGMWFVIPDTVSVKFGGEKIFFYVKIIFIFVP